MHTKLKTAVAVAGLFVAAQAAAQVTFYEREDFRGREFTASGTVDNFSGTGFNDRASSVVVERGRWEACEDANFQGRCVVLRPGRYDSLSGMGMSNRISSVRPINREARENEAEGAAQVTFYERENFRGGEFAVAGAVDNFSGTGFNDRASSVIVERGRWEVCEDANFQGRCVVLRPGRYDSLAGMGMNHRISSIRPLDREARYENEPEAPLAVYAYQPRPDERLYQVNVTSVHAVVGPPEQRCWVERQQVEDRSGGANVPGAIVGAIIGGVLGHQVGGGRGQDVATAGGAVAGAAIGSNAGRGSGQVYSQEVQRCASVPSSARPEFWDVTYYFRGQEHRVQMSAPPGPTLTVNGDGEPRG